MFRLSHGSPPTNRQFSADYGVWQKSVPSIAVLRCTDSLARAFHEVATARGATLAQIATLWLLRRPEITTVLIGASKVSQIDDIHSGLSQPALSAAELARIEGILACGFVRGAPQGSCVEASRVEVMRCGGGASAL